MGAAVSQFVVEPIFLASVGLALAEREQVILELAVAEIWCTFRIERLSHEAEVAKRRCSQHDLQNRLVVAALGKDWNEALGVLPRKSRPVSDSLLRSRGVLGQ